MVKIRKMSKTSVAKKEKKNDDHEDLIEKQTGMKYGNDMIINPDNRTTINEGTFSLQSAPTKK